MLDPIQLALYRQSLPEPERYETQRFFVVRWDIVAARLLIHRNGKAPCVVNVVQTSRANGLDRPQGINSPCYIDETQAMSSDIDTTIPVILALIARENEGAHPIPLLIDGLHQVFKAYREEKRQIPCYVLTPGEEQLCRIRIAR